MTVGGIDAFIKFYKLCRLCVRCEIADEFAVGYGNISFTKEIDKSFCCINVLCTLGNTNRVDKNIEAFLRVIERKTFVAVPHCKTVTGIVCCNIC